jgi:Bacterial pre-peptidase C-terminal domain
LTLDQDRLDMPKPFIRRALLACALLPLAACEGGVTTPELDEFLGCSRVSGIALPGTVSGSLSADDCAFSDGAYVDFYTIRVSGSRDLAITMTSGSVDSYLVLLTSGGTVLDSNDDNGASVDSRIDTTLSTGTYVIAATSFEGGETGSYSLRVQ